MKHAGPWLIMAVLFWLSHQPVLVPVGGNDKVAHFIAYFVLALSWSLALAKPGRSFLGTLSAPALFATTYGILDEFHQSFVPGRTATIDDALADAAGAWTAALLFAWVWRRRTAQD